MDAHIIAAWNAIGGRGTEIGIAWDYRLSSSIVSPSLAVYLSGCCYYLGCPSRRCSAKAIRCRHVRMRQGSYSPGVRAKLQFSISPLRLGVEIDMHAGLIAFAQIEDTANDIDARRAFAIFNSLVLYLIPYKRFQA